jgi:hypothetical protein
VPEHWHKDEGGHTAAWQLPATPAPIPMGPDLFVDGAQFAPNDVAAG